MENPNFIYGGIHSDERGTLSFVNEFSFSKIKRFYIISNNVQKPLRAWQGHKLDEKNFYCIHGEFKIAVVKIDDWENPSKNLEVNTFTLNALDSKILKVPPGFANAVLSTAEGSKLLSFSTINLENVIDDDVRYPEDYWKWNE